MHDKLQIHASIPQHSRHPQLLSAVLQLFFSCSSGDEPVVEEDVGEEEVSEEDRQLLEELGY